MKKIQSKQLLLKLGSVLSVLLLAAYFVPHIYATSDFTASNVTFDPATSYLTFDVTGRNLSTSTTFQIRDAASSSAILWTYQPNPTTAIAQCTSSHCWTVLHPGVPDSGVSSVFIRANDGLGGDSQSLDYPLPLATTYTPQNPSAGTKAYEVYPTDGQTTTSTTYVDMTSGT